MQERTGGILYRLYDDTDTLLYIGESGRTNVQARLREHARKHPWWPEVHRWTAEVAADRFAAERRAVRDEAPKYNVQRFRDKARLHKATCSHCSLIVYLTHGAAERCGMPTCACGAAIAFTEDASDSATEDATPAQLAFPT